MLDKKLLKNFDISVILIVILLVAIGLVMISSATHVHETQDYSLVKKQLFFFVLGLTAIVVISNIDYRTFANFCVYMYIAGVLFLVAVLFTEPINGARSWFKIFGFGLQPSEYFKIVIIITFSRHIEKIKEKGEEDINSFKNILLLLLHMGLPILLIMVQPDWGTATVYIGIMIIILFVANISYKYIIAAFASASVILPLLFFFVMKGYQRNRLLTFWNPEVDPLGAGYQFIQAKIAIGSGQLFGKGLFKGIQTQLGYLPEQETDLIFPVIGEELGFIWCSIIIIMFVALLLRLVYLATLAKDYFGSYVITGVAAMIFFHVLINIGMTIGLAPMMGIPLPFLSYGGSSLLANMIAVGLALNVAMRRQKINF